MLVIGIFPNDMGAAQALIDMVNAGIGKDRLLVVPMDASAEEAKNVAFNPIAGQSSVEVGIAVATACAVVCISRGFVLPWGPIVWGLIGAIGGFAIGFFIHQSLMKRRRTGIRIDRASELTVIVECAESERQTVLDALWNNNALSVGLRTESP